MKSSIFLFPFFPKLVPNMYEKYLEISIYLLMYTGSVITWEVVYCWGKILFLVITFSIELSFCFLRASTAAYKYDSFKYSKWSISHNSKFCYNQLKCSDSKCISSQLFTVRFEGTSVESLVIIVYKINLNHSNIVCDHSLSCVWFCNRMETDTVAHQAPLSRDFPGKNTGVGCHFLLQRIFATQGSNPHLLCLWHWQVGFTYWFTWEALVLYSILCRRWRSEMLFKYQNKWPELGAACSVLFFSIIVSVSCYRASLVAQMVKNLPGMWETRVQSLG